VIFLTSPNPHAVIHGVLRKRRIRVEEYFKKFITTVMAPLVIARMVAFLSIVSAVGTVVINWFLCLNTHASLVKLQIEHEGDETVAEPLEGRWRFYKLAVQSTAIISMLALVQFMSSVYLLSAGSNKDAVAKCRVWILLTVGLAWTPIIVCCAAFSYMAKMYVNFQLDRDYLFKFYISNFTIIVVHLITMMIVYVKVKNVKNVKYEFLNEDA